ncbi:hypothetical protein M408DRAFT_122873 [Serendipita vermifera MAFF 305830]|uniref:DUF6535 domain-containing protein n=1 Tax=Serendipita vermifera MAFF 305830 TaxID=933852 RepID=A0A0C2W2V9_SERVB|nr:hypothetical protein M408DRAFT_122873 [Serendipita vermifera MAFF 305830]
MSEEKAEKKQDVGGFKQRAVIGNEQKYSGVMSEEERLLGLEKEYSGWDVYNNEAKKVDTELVKDWTSSLNFLLVFAAIFAAVLTAFIIESKKLLEQDPTSVMVDVMIFFTNNMANGTHTPYTPPEFEAKKTDIIVNCLFYASLSASLVAALASVVALQWVADYDAAITRGGSSPEDRAKRRQFRHAGVVSWRMGEVIATLPLLLYFSVVLFFSGLILWMWSLNYIVGAVVAGGLALAVLFYGSSTLIAVVWISAPFRTPLSRWIYSFFNLPLSFFYRIRKVGGGSQSPTAHGLPKQVCTAAYKREDQAVQEGMTLAKDAMDWLASQINISPDSYRRLLLLAGELPNLIPTPTFTSNEAAWYAMFDVLGMKYLAYTQVDDLSAEEIQGMATLQQCCMLTAVQKLVSPDSHVSYITSIEDINYWSQYCYAGKPALSPPSNRRPNHLFLLLRDTPRTAASSNLELEFIIRIAHWRNLDVKVSQVWEDVFASEKLLSTDFFNYCVTTFGSFCRLQNWYKWSKEYAEMYLSVTNTLIRIAARRGDLVAQSVEALIQTHEALVIGYGNLNMSGSTTPHLIRMFPYGKEIASDKGGAYELLPFLLATQLDSYSSVDKFRRAREVIAMLWLRPSNPITRDWDYLMQKNSAFAKETNLTMNWITQADRIPYIRDILRHLATAQAGEPRIGPLWRTTHLQEYNNPYFVEALETFDSLMKEDCTSADHLAMISLVCQDLEQKSKPDFTGYFTRQRLESISKLADPCLQVLANCARGIEHTSPFMIPQDGDFELKDSWDRIERFLLKEYPLTTSPAALQLQASLWPTFYGQREYYRNALDDPDCLMYLQRLFQYPVNCTGCLDGPGHLLFHILKVVTPRGFVPKNPALVPTSPTRSHSLLLADSLNVNVFESVNTKPHLLDLSPRSLKLSQHQLLTMAWNMSSPLQRKPANQLSELEQIILVIYDAIQCRHEPESVLLLAPLASRLLELRELSLAQGKGSFARRESASTSAIEISKILLTNLGSQFVFGLGNSRMVSCARATGDIRPALGWQPPYVD